MFITVNDIPKIVNEYLLREIVPKVKSDVVKFSLSFCAGYLGNHTINTILGKYGAIISAFGIIDDNGKIDVELMRDNAVRAIKACPNQKFEYMGYVADEDDIDALYKIMVQYAKNHDEKIIN